jgi:hypothetical protein
MPSQASMQRILLFLNEQIQWSIQLFYIYLLIAMMYCTKYII